MIQPPLGKPWLLYGLLGCSLLLNLVMVFDRDDGSEAAASSAAPDASQELVFQEAAPEAVAETVAPAGVEEAVPSAAEGAAAAELAAAEAVAEVDISALSAAGWQVVDTSLERNLAYTLKGAVGDQGGALAQVYARLFVWDLDLRRDLQKGDRVQVAWRMTEQGKVEIGAARLHSLKHGRTYTAYRWHAPEDAFASYWSDDGTEVPHRLTNSPLRDYEQITSLLKDRPSHEGMDFKTPVGTPIVSPFAGQVKRTDWNWAANGNCIEVAFTNGAVAKFLHLSETGVTPGQSVAAGEIIGRTGNTGRSTAPHLHYQVEKGGTVLDPLDFHGSERRRLTGTAVGAFQAEARRFDALLDGALAMR